MSMTAKQLSAMISNLDAEVVIKLSQPSVGPTACSSICGLSIGFDWDEGKVILIPSTNLISKEMT